MFSLSKPITLILSLCASFCAAVLGGAATGSSVSTWFQDLQKPSWNPPDWVFGPVWTVLYTLIGVAAWLVWEDEKTPQPDIEAALGWHGVQLGLNALWSILFFGLRRPDLALLNIVALLGAIVVTMLKFWPIRPLAVLLFAPYLLWVSFATLLNGAIWWLNRGS